MLSGSELLVPTHSYLSDSRFVEIICLHYNIKSCINYQYFIQKNLFSIKKVTSFPHNYSKNIAVEVLNEYFLKGIELAKQNQVYFDYKGYNLPNDNFLKEQRIAKDQLGVSNIVLLTSKEKLLANYKPRHRSKVMKSFNEWDGKVKTFKSDQLEDFESWYSLLLSQYKKKHKMLCQPYPLLKDLFFYENSSLWIQRFKDKVIGGIFLLHDTITVDYCWGAFDTNIAPKNSGLLLLHHALESSISMGHIIFNLGMSNLNDNNLRFFKSRWGGKEIPIYYASWNHKPKIIDYNHDYYYAKKIIPLLPDKIFKMICKTCVPYLI